MIALSEAEVEDDTPDDDFAFRLAHVIFLDPCVVELTRLVVSLVLSMLCEGFGV